jgi:hypothetical protein
MLSLLRAHPNPILKYKSRNGDFSRGRGLLQLVVFAVPPEGDNPKTAADHYAHGSENRPVRDVRREKQQSDPQKRGAYQEQDEVGETPNGSGRRSPLRHDVANARSVGRQDVVLVVTEFPLPCFAGFFPAVH